MASALPCLLLTVIMTPPISLESRELFLKIKLRLMCSVRTFSSPVLEPSRFLGLVSYYVPGRLRPKLFMFRGISSDIFSLKVRGALYF